MPYIYHTDDDRKQMLDAIGIDSVDRLFDGIPPRFRLQEPLAIGEGLSEFETLKLFERLADKNSPAGGMTNFLGGGIYDHAVPSIIKHLAGRSEFYTAYTPYQAEVSQGTLQAIFEYQSLISRLTAMPVANASMYDGATAFAESALMAAKVTGRSRVLVSSGAHPRYRAVLQTYAGGQDLQVTEIAVTGDGDVDRSDLERHLSDDVAAVLLQTPNYIGVVESPWRYRGAIERVGALLVVAVDPLSLSLFQPPGDYGADIAVGEGQSLGNDMNFGGPLLGFMTCQEKYIRNLPGRLVSETQDIEGRRAYVLTLQTREQHIRRDKATSNICTNQGLLALRATIYLSLLGERGYRQLGKLCYAKAHRLAGMVAECPGYSLPYGGVYFREFVVRCPGRSEVVLEKARAAGILAGIPLRRYFGDKASNDLLIAVTEKRTEEDFEKLCRVFKEVA